MRSEGAPDTRVRAGGGGGGCVGAGCRARLRQRESAQRTLLMPGSSFMSLVPPMLFTIFHCLRKSLKSNLLLIMRCMASCASSSCKRQQKEARRSKREDLGWWQRSALGPGPAGNCPALPRCPSGRPIRCPRGLWLWLTLPRTASACNPPCAGKRLARLPLSPSQTNAAATNARAPLRGEPADTPGSCAPAPPKRTQNRCKANTTRSRTVARPPSPPSP